GIARADAVKELAAEAGWSIVLYGTPTDPVDVHVDGQPADRVLELLLADGVYEVSRKGDLIAVKRLDAGDAAAPAAPPPPAPKVRGSDRVVSGHSLRIEQGEIVHDVSVLGGSADVLGTVTGDLSVMGGSAHLYEGAHVMGDAATVGGSLVID